MRTPPLRLVVFSVEGDRLRASLLLSDLVGCYFAGGSPLSIFHLACSAGIRLLGTLGWG